MGQEDYRLLGEEAEHHEMHDEPGRTVAEGLGIRATLNATLTFGLIASLLLNIVLGLTLYKVEGCGGVMEKEKTLYAGLQYNKVSTWEASSPYTGPNMTAADQAWLDIDIDYAFVALSNDHSSHLGLLPSLPFPWDRKQKSLYLITSVHSLHCLQILHQSNLEYRTDHTQTYPTEHLLHCLDNLRADLECSADDTLRYVPVHAHVSTVSTGIGQPRQCRDWSQLRDWAKSNSACFNYHEFARSELNETNVYPSAWSYCKEGSEYLPAVQDFYNKSKSWVPLDPGLPSKDNVHNIMEFGQSHDEGLRRE
ncbi:hypothetical protein LTR17_014328 [Elasticomyces elasticus]|nr:hypothetical protein LTR17_014328 [Elasticomyces elasticus]